ncbi:hypothetical protein S40293_11597 [Stachybotrys chartarum IBT 40293]|nr:hypothetical protein S40293_11597 [Stachybotrys chartarum IBT 40293]
MWRLGTNSIEAED